MCSISYIFCWITCPYLIWRNILCDNAASTNDGTLAMAIVVFLSIVFNVGATESTYRLLYM